MENLLILLTVAAIVAAVTLYLIRAKRRGQTCIGCPYAKSCAKHQCACPDLSQKTDAERDS